MKKSNDGNMLCGLQSAANFPRNTFKSLREKRGRMGRLEGIESLLEIGQQAFIYTVFCLFMDMTDIIIVIDIK